MSNYFDSSVYNPAVDNRYYDYNNRLYETDGGVGGPETYKLKSVKVVSQNSKNAIVKIKIDEFGPAYDSRGYYRDDAFVKTHTRTLKLKYVNGKWVFCSPFYIIYGPSKI